MKQQSTSQAILIGVLGMLVMAAVLALFLTYSAYLPTITSIPLHQRDAWLGDAFFRIARNSFFISGVSGLVLGLAVPVIVRKFRGRDGKHTG